MTKLTDEQLTKLHAIRAALVAAERAHPDSRNLTVLHARMNEALPAFQSMMEPDQYEALSGGTDKGDPNPPPPTA